MGPAGRRLHIAHRRSPSELTPLMSGLHRLSPS
jgi:protein SSD1